MAFQTFQFNNLAIIESHPSDENAFFSPTRDRLFRFFHNAGLFARAQLDQDDGNQARRLNEIYEVNFFHFSDDDSIASLNELAIEDVRTCRRNLQRVLRQTQPLVALFVGSQLARDFFRRPVHPGLVRVKRWQHTGGNVTLCYVIPSTSRHNRRTNAGEIQRAIEEFRECLLDHHIQCQ